MSFFFNIFTACFTIDSWESWNRPVIFYARSDRKLRLTMLKLSSIGL